MNFSDLVLILMIVTFLPFNEGIIAKSPKWKKLADLIEFGVLKAVTWRANANVTNELDILIRYFKRTSIATGVVCVAAVFIKSQPLLLLASVVFAFSFFSWFSFKWTFKHTDAIQPFAPMVGYSLIAPWGLLLLDSLSPEAGLIKAFAPLLQFLPFHPTTPFDIALTLFLFFVAFFGLYYVFGWLMFSPFAYCVLAGLKLSRNASAFLVSRFNRNLLNDISVFIQLFGVVYFYWASRQG